MCGRCGLPIPLPHQRQSANQHDRAPGEEPEVPGQQIVGALFYVVEPEQVMIDDAFDHIKRPPADQQTADQ